MRTVVAVLATRGLMTPRIAFSEEVVLRAVAQAVRKWWTE